MRPPGASAPGFFLMLSWSGGNLLLQLDLPTLVVALVALSVAIGAPLALISGPRQGTRALRWWAFALLAVAGGSVLLVLRGAIPTLVSIVFGNALIIATLALVGEAASCLTSARLDARARVFLTAVTGPLLGVLYLTVEPIWPRVAYMAAAEAFLAGQLAWQLHRARKASGARHPSVFAFELLLWALLAETLFRTAAVLVLMPNTPYLGQTLVQVAFLFALLLVAVGTCTLIWHELAAKDDAIEVARTSAAAGRERQELLEREKRALQEADRSKDEFIAMMSHELRNPLAALTTASWLLENLKPDDEASVHARDVIGRQTRQMTRLIEDLLDVSRVLMGKANLQLEAFNLAEAISGVLETWSAAGRFEPGRVRSDTSAVWVNADRARVEQVLGNLLDNALKFSAPDQKVVVSVREKEGGALLQVADQGVGLEPAMMKRMFDLFAQGEQGLARKSGGMGVGLALVKRLVELQGGRVSAASEGAGRGAVFTVRFPSVSARAATPAAPVAKAPRKSRRILIIEDNADVRRTLADSLLLSGHDVHEAADGSAGLEVAAAAHPEIVLIDIGLPDIDGYEVARRLRSAGGTGSARLIALTGYGHAEDRQRSSNAGFDGHLTKPVPPERLEDAIAAV
jgi:signal transduction histidine kinase